MNIKIKTQDLIGPALDWAVFVASGYSYWLSSKTPRDNNDGYTDWLLDKTGLNRYVFDGSRSRAGHWDVLEAWAPSTDPAQGQPIMEREKLAVWTADGFDWHARSFVLMLVLDGPTMLIAAMRCYVASKLGDEVDVPEELL